MPFLPTRTGPSPPPHDFVSYFDSSLDFLLSLFPLTMDRIEGIEKALLFLEKKVDDHLFREPMKGNVVDFFVSDRSTADRLRRFCKDVTERSGSSFFPTNGPTSESEGKRFQSSTQEEDFASESQLLSGSSRPKRRASSQQSCLLTDFTSAKRIRNVFPASGDAASDKRCSDAASLQRPSPHSSFRVTTLDSTNPAPRNRGAINPAPSRRIDEPPLSSHSRLRDAPPPSIPPPSFTPPPPAHQNPIAKVPMVSLLRPQTCKLLQELRQQRYATAGALPQPRAAPPQPRHSHPPQQTLQPHNRPSKDRHSRKPHRAVTTCNLEDEEWRPSVRKKQRDKAKERDGVTAGPVGNPTKRLGRRRASVQAKAVIRKNMEAETKPEEEEDDEEDEEEEDEQSDESDDEGDQKANQSADGYRVKTSHPLRDRPLPLQRFHQMATSDPYPDSEASNAFECSVKGVKSLERDFASEETSEMNFEIEDVEDVKPDVGDLDRSHLSPPSPPEAPSLPPHPPADFVCSLNVVTIVGDRFQPSDPLFPCRLCDLLLIDVETLKLHMVDDCGYLRIG